jgi:hypothetical protein
VISTRIVGFEVNRPRLRGLARRFCHHARCARP